LGVDVIVEQIGGVAEQRLAARRLDWAEERVLAMKYVAVLQRESDGGYVVSVPALPGCVSQGDTRDEALANIREAMELYLVDCRLAGDPIPAEDCIEFTELTISAG
jgi:predicted RNase H-like HicB family nuclease